MRRSRKKSNKIRKFILENVEDHHNDITSFTAEKFDISRVSVLRHLNILIKNGLISVQGKTKDREYKLKSIIKDSFSVEISPDVEEDQIWLHIIRPILINIPDNVLQICEYGLSEMINNVIDHSEGNLMEVKIKKDAIRVHFTVQDDGVGIFEKIQRDFNLNDPRHAILELAKGKLTTDPAHHTGEGIYFTSRMFDRFIIISKGLFYSHKEPDDDWLLEHNKNINGTAVKMTINIDSDRKIQDIFDKFALEEQDYEFSRTHVPLYLIAYGDENLISRSQARRLLARFHNFKQVMLDFEGIKSIGQAFADEIFRIYARNNPDIEIIALNTNQQVAKMISRVQKNLRSY